MKQDYGFNGNGLCILVGVVGLITFSVGVNDNALSQSNDGNKLHIVEEGNTLKLDLQLEISPAMGQKGESSTVKSLSLNDPISDPKPVAGVLKPGDEISAGRAGEPEIIQTFDCDPPVGTFPNLQCHPRLEDRLGCNGGGTGTYCDTVQIPGGTNCKCEDL